MHENSSLLNKRHTSNRLGMRLQNEANYAHRRSYICDLYTCFQSRFENVFNKNVISNPIQRVQKMSQTAKMSLIKFIINFYIIFLIIVLLSKIKLSLLN